MIFGHRLQNDAPPKVSVNLDVPFVPTRIDRIAPAFFFEQLKNCAEQVMPVASFVAPKNSASQARTAFGVGRQMFVGADNVARRPFEVKPSKVTRKSANERLDKGQTHHEQSRRHRIELWFDQRAHHVRERDGQRSTKHQIGDNSERRQKNSEAEEKKREGEPFDTAEIGGDVRLRSGVHRLEKTFTENTVIDDRPINEPTESRCAINLTAPFRSPGRPEKNQVLEAKERFGFAITLLLLQKCAQSKSAMVPDNRGGTES